MSDRGAVSVFLWLNEMGVEWRGWQANESTAQSQTDHGGRFSKCFLWRKHERGVRVQREV